MGMLPHPGSCPHGQCPFRNIPRLEEDAESDKGDLLNNYPNISWKKQELKKEIEQSARDMLLDSAHSSGRSAELELSVSVSLCVCAERQIHGKKGGRVRSTLPHSVTIKVADQ